MSDLVTWLRAQLDEDARVAMQGGEDVETWIVARHGSITTASDYPHVVARCDEMDWEAQTHIARHDPARVLREVAAKRAIVDGFAALNGDPTRHDHAALHLQWHVLRIAVQHLASAYSDRPGYREEWRP